MFKRFIAIAVAVLLMFSLVSCDASAPKEDSDETAKADININTEDETVDTDEDEDETLEAESDIEEGGLRKVKSVFNSTQQYNCIFEYKPNVIEVKAFSNVQCLVSYDSVNRVATVGGRDATVESVNGDDYIMKVFYDENNRIIAFEENGGFRTEVEYSDDNTIILTGKYTTDIIEVNETEISLCFDGSADGKTVYTANEFGITEFSEVLADRDYKFSVDYDDAGNITQTTKEHEGNTQIQTFEYYDEEVEHPYETVLNAVLVGGSTHSIYVQLLIAQMNY